MIQLDPLQWQRLKDILADALDQGSTTTRAAFVRRSCGADAKLLSAAEALLRGADDLISKDQDQLEAFSNFAATRLTRWETWPAGCLIGPYEITAKLARGGMGAVYRARRADGTFEREVAIKAVKRGVDTDEVLRRFQRERHILARLDHPNIARLLDAGATDDGLPYFVMDYVSGTAITSYVQARQLNMRDRLALFLKVCSAVDAAHQAHIVHRDLKPSNILVTPEGEPKLLDFGIAKVLVGDDPAFEETTADDRRLTPLYTSPEQINADPVTPATDVYSLGVVLYEVLTGRLPYTLTTRSREAVARAICEEAPRPPSVNVQTAAERRQLRGPLDAITMFALRKDPARRYATAGELGAEIESYLKGQAVRARPAGFNERVVRLLKARATINPIVWAAAIVIAGGVYFLWSNSIRPRSGATRPNETVSTVAVPPNSVAVLPFNRIGDKNDSPSLAEVIHEEVLTSLGKISALQVTAGTSVAHLTPDRARDVRNIGRQLGVAHLIEGSVQKDGPEARLHLRLVHAVTGAQEWADQFDMIHTSPAAIASAIARKLQVSTRSVELPQQYPEMVGDLAAYDLYLQGKAIVDGFTDTPDLRASLVRAVDLLSEAKRREPTFLLAWWYLARAHALLFGWNSDDRDAHAEAADAAAREALRLAPDSGEAHLAMAEVIYRTALVKDFARAAELTRAELELAWPKVPNSPVAYVLSALVDRRSDHWASAEDNFARAVALDPRNRYAIELLADTQFLRRKYAAAKQTYRRALDANVLLQNTAVRMATIDFAARGETASLRQALQAHPEEVDVGGTETYLRVMVELVDGHYDEARRVLARARVNEFLTLDLSFLYPRSWLEGLIARAAGDEPGMRDAFGRARVTFGKALAEFPNAPRFLLFSAMIDGSFGEKQAALDKIDRARKNPVFQNDAYNRPNVLRELVQAYVWVGETKLALEHLRELVSMPGYVSYGELKHDPAWRPLRGEPEFEAIVQQLAPRE